MIEYIIIAILQGIFEWLPISSSGQVMIISINFFGISPDQAFSLAIWLHFGTALAVLAKYRLDFIEIIKSFKPDLYKVKDKDIKRRNWIIFATIGTAITGIPLYFLFKILLIFNFTATQGDIITITISGFLIITGIILLKLKKVYATKSIEDISEKEILKNSSISGVFQGFSILPGISRSGITTSVILYEKYKQEDALNLSFLMSVPVVFASIGVDIIFGEGSVFGTLNLLEILLTTLTSFIIGYLTMEVLLRIAKKIQFGYFCIIYGLISFAIITPFLFMN
jgi:undecaprenyl-diphosphatase